MEMEGVRAGEVVPELLEFQRCVDISVRPEKGNDLSKNDEARGFAVGSGTDGREDVFYERFEQGDVEYAVDHKTGEGFSGIERAISAEFGRDLKIEPDCFQAFGKSLAMRLAWRRRWPHRLP